MDAVLQVLITGDRPQGVGHNKDVLYIHRKLYILFRISYILTESDIRYQTAIYIVQDIRILYIFIANHICYSGCHIYS